MTDPTNKETCTDEADQKYTPQNEEVVAGTDNDVNEEEGARFKIITWNTWCMIFAPRTLSNPQRCSNYVLKIARQENWTDFDGLIVCSFQELWAWKTGIFPPIILRGIAYCEYIPYLGVVISCLFQFLSLLIGILPILKCLPISYDPKKQMVSNLKRSVPYSYYDSSVPLLNVLDNGLLLLTNHAADDHGCNGYENHACDDSLAYKGYVWAYFKQFHCLVLNTHLQSAGTGKERLAQVQELNDFIKGYQSKFEEALKVIVCGDFNIDMTNHDEIVQAETQQADETVIWRSKSYANLPKLVGESFVKCNGCNYGTWENENLDHILCNFEFVSFAEEIRGKEGKLSDHYLVQNELVCSASNLNRVDIASI